MTNTRIETDSFGALEVPAEKYFGAQTARSLINFPIGTETLPLPLVSALGIVKQSQLIGLPERWLTGNSTIISRCLSGRQGPAPSQT